MPLFFRKPLWLFLLLPLLLHGQEWPAYTAPETRILFVFDASQSMLGFWQKNRRIDIAREVMISIIDSLEKIDHVKMALRLYGHQSTVPPQDCSDTRLEVPFGERTAPKIRQKIRYLVPKGTTPIAHSLEQAARDFPPACDNCRNIIILVTDGIEACDGDPCDVSIKLQQQGIVLKPFVIGIGIDDNFKESFECVGHYYNAVHEERFKEIMEVVISQALNATTAQVNLLDAMRNPTETNVNLTFYDQFSGRIIYNYIHTMNSRGRPDTLVLDHLVTYRMRVHTIPPVDVKEIKLHVGKHTVIAADVPQGRMKVVTPDGRQYRDQQYIVRKSGEMATLNVQKFYDEEKYLTGKYDIEIPILPRYFIHDVEIKQDHLTTIEVPRPGILNLVKTTNGFGSVYLRKSNLEEEWVCNINPNVRNESILLQPGKYRVVYRAANARQTLYTVNRTFQIRSGASEVVNLY